MFLTVPLKLLWSTAVALKLLLAPKLQPYPRPTNHKTKMQKVHLQKCLKMVEKRKRKGSKLTYISFRVYSLV